MPTPTRQTRLRFSPPRLPSGDYPATYEELIEILSQSRIEGDLTTPINFGPDEPDTEGREFPWLRTNSQGRTMGWFVWDPSLAGACSGWRCVDCLRVGETKTVIRTSTTVELDREAKGIKPEYGWRIADDGGALDLTDNEAFFLGSSPDWDLYTVYRTS